MQDLSGLEILVTAGPTLEYIDPIRIITNKSSRKMRVAIAEEALQRGARVTLIYGRGRISPPPKARIIRVETTKQMYERVISELKSRHCDVVIAAAAVADWTPVKPYTKKISTRETSSLVLKLKPTPKIIDEVKKINSRIFLAAFKAEYNLSNEELIERAYERLREANADLMIANDLARSGAGFGSDTSEVFIVDDKKKVIHLPLAPKREIAKGILDIIRKKVID